MELNNLTAISPIDGRYRKQVAHLDEYFSEYALIKYRVLVEIEYFLFLSDKKFFNLPTTTRKKLQGLAESFALSDAAEIKKLESTTNHDVKAVEYYLKTKLEERLPKFGGIVFHEKLGSQADRIARITRLARGDVRKHGWCLGHFRVSSTESSSGGSGAGRRVARST